MDQGAAPAAAGAEAIGQHVDDALHQLDRILASKMFARVQHQARDFLIWIVIKTLLGESEQIKEPMIAVNVYNELLDRKLKPIGMDKPRWRVLMVLFEHNSAALGLLAEMAVMKLPTMHKVVQRMEEDGLVTTSPRPSDNRVTEVRMTAKGRTALVEIRRQASNVFE